MRVAEERTIRTAKLLLYWSLIETAKIMSLRKKRRNSDSDSVKRPGALHSYLLRQVSTGFSCSQHQHRRQLIECY